MIIRKFYFWTVALVLFSSCAILKPPLDKKVAKLELGMSKKEALTIVGTSYSLLSAVKTDKGTTESILLKDEKSSNYVLTFLGNELVEIKRDRFGNVRTEQNRPAKKEEAKTVD